MKTLPLLLALALLGGCATPTARQSQPPPVAAADASPAAPAVAEIRTIQSLREIEAPLRELAGRGGPVLLVLDIDDTLLTSDTFFGSDRWYEWQRSLKPPHPALVRCRFDFIALNYEAGTQRETEPGAAKFINGIRLPKLLLTARGADYRGATERELRLAGYTLPVQLAPRFEGWRYPNHPGTDKPVAAVSYANGIAMLTGRDKGEALLDLLERSGRRYAAIALVDDGLANIESLRHALGSRGIDYYGFHYVAIEKRHGPDGALLVSAEEEQQAIRAVRAWTELLGEVYPNRGARLEKQDARDACGY